jgi:hypothetical protein
MKLLRVITGIGSASSVASIVCALAVAACSGGTALVSNHVGIVATATTIDANLSNRLGAVTAPGLPFWIADNSGNLASHYSGTEAIQTKESAGSSAAGIAIPASAAGVPANPNGEVYNGNGGFLIPTSKGQERSEEHTSELQSLS